jgi:hypothetical protein
LFADAGVLFSPRAIDSTHVLDPLNRLQTFIGWSPRASMPAANSFL